MRRQCRNIQDMEDLKYIPFYLDWVELMRTKDTDAKKVAFFDAIVDYALHGTVPPAPMALEDPHGVDYARRDGYLIANRQLDYIIPKIRAGASGGKSGKGDSKSRYRKQNASESQAERKQNASKTQAINIKDKDNNNIGVSNETPAGFVDEGFKKFWEAYPPNCPRKVDKKRCRAKWGAMFKNLGSEGCNALLAAVMDGLEKWKASEQWHKDGGQFIRAPLAWLNNENWKDAPATKPEDADEARRKRFVQTEQAIKEDLHRKGLL